MSNSVQSYGLQPSSLLCPWDSPGKNTGVGCHALLQGNLLDPGIELPTLISSALAQGSCLGQWVLHHQHQLDPAIPLLGIYPENMRALFQKHTYLRILFAIAETWKQHKCPSTDDCIKMLHTPEYHSARERRKFYHLQQRGWMDLKNIMLIEISQRKAKLCDITYMWNLNLSLFLSLYIYKYKYIYIYM